MAVSILVISDVNRFFRLRNDWDRQLRDHVEDPFFSSSMLVEHWRFGLKLGWTPFLMVFLSDDKIVGFAPLLLRQRFGLKKISNFDQYTCPDFLFDNYREDCIRKMVNYLFRQLKCESAEITFMRDSANQKVFEKTCDECGLTLKRLYQEGQAILPVKTSLELFKKSLKGHYRKKFKVMRRRLDQLGSWNISCLDLNSYSLKKIWEVENHSWKMNLHGEKKAIKDWGLESILFGVERSREGEWLFKTEVWFLNLNHKPIAYVLAFKSNKTVFFAKTSFNLRFKAVSPGIFLMNDLIETIFKENIFEKIDFYSNLPFVRAWRPLVLERIKLNVKDDSALSIFPRLFLENRFSDYCLGTVNRLKWKKRVG
jgi:hypothetical protein